jgi:SAM-dependent methyltransferase
MSHPMRNIGCPICRKDEGRTIYGQTLTPDAMPTAAGPMHDPEHVHYRIRECSGCRLRYSSPIFDEAGVRDLYAHAAHTNVRSGEEGNVKRTFELYYEHIRPHLARRDRMLDIGCDTGMLLDVARRDGFRELVGIEPNPVAAAQAAAVPGSSISRTFYEATVFPSEHFDLITLIHVVDHLVDVNEFLARVRGHLRRGGVVLAVVHNVESLLERLLGERFPPYNVYHHYFFSKRTLRLLFERAGFDVAVVRATYNCYSTGFLLDKAPLLPPILRRLGRGALRTLGADALPLSLPLGNIGIVARKPAATGSGQ